jgi:hypothetical protein
VRSLLHSSDRTRGLLLVAGAFGGALALSAWAHRVVETSSINGPAPSVEGLVGWPRSVDPVQALGPARRLASRSHLTGLVATGVRVDGRVDAHGPGRVRYVFQSPPGRGPRVRETRFDERKRACGRQIVRLGPYGLTAGEDDPARSCPEPPSEPLPDPKCGPRELWALALAKGASGTALARTEYFRSTSGPAWSFRISRREVNFTADEYCKRELSPSEARWRGY